MTPPWSAIPPCAECAPLGSLGMMPVKKVGVSAVDFCKCAKGQARRQQEAQRKASQGLGYAEPRLSVEQAQIFVEGLEMPDYPRSSIARGKIGAELRQLANTPDQADWLVTRMVRLFRRWPGIAVMRIVFCAKYVPLDGVIAGECGTLGWCEEYPLGIPSERPVEPEQKLLTAGPRGTQISAAPSIQAAVDSLAEMKDLNNLGRKTVDVRPIPSERQRVITQADIDGAVERMRADRCLSLQRQAEREIE